MNSRGVSLVLCAYLLISTFSIIVSIPEEASAYTPHAPIYIINNGNFTAANGVTGGTGTSIDPYIIEGWEINASADRGIVIANTDALFTIRDVYIHSGSPLNDGIFLYNVSNGRIENATILNNRYGIRLWDRANVDIVGNNISYNKWDGIIIDSFTDVNITGNTIFSNGGYGIVYRTSSDANITDNNISSNDGFGIYLQGSINTSISNTTFTSNGIFIWGGELSHYNSHTVTADNFVNGKLLHFYKDCSNLDIDSIPLGQLIVVNCTAVRAANLVITDTDVGVEMAYVDGAVVTGNNISFNNHKGFFLTHSTNASIWGNNISNHEEEGVYIEHSTNVSMVGNTVTSSTYYGIRLEDTDYLTLDSNDVSNHSWAISLDRSVNSTIIGNNVSHNTQGMTLVLTANLALVNNDVYLNIIGIGFGISLNTSVIDNRVVSNSAMGMSLGTVDNPRVIGNTFSDNREGLELYRVSNATISGNNMSSNEQYGVFLQYSVNNTLDNNTISNNALGLRLDFSRYNRIYHNNILNNSEQAIDKTDTNEWDNDYPSGGNYWSNYTGIDNCSGPNQNICPDPDAIGDTPFIIDADSQDRYPWMFSFGTVLPRPPADLQVALSGKDFENVTLTWSLSPDDGKGLKSVVGYKVYRNVTHDLKGLGYQLYVSLPSGTSQFVDVSAGEGNPSNYFYQACAVDLNNNTTCAKNQAGKFTRLLSRGLNLVSISLVQSNESIEKILQTVRFDKAWAFDSAGKKWNWFMSSKPYKGELRTIDHRTGVWVNVTEGSNFTAAGIVPTTTTINLYAGWNLLGFPSFRDDYAVLDLRMAVLTERIEGFDAAAPPYYLKALTDGDVLQTGFGYWIKVENVTSWTVDNF